MIRYREMSFKDFQNEILEIYRETQKIFKEVGIKSWGHSGTLMGVVRHSNKMIPWDDDIDLMVSYKDYFLNKDELIKKFNAKESKYYLMDFAHEDKVVEYNSKKYKISKELKFLRVYTRDKFLVVSNGNYSLTRGFIDIVFGGPSNTFKTEIGWRRFANSNKNNWIYESGFDRFQPYFWKKGKRFFMNTITYPLKLPFIKYFHNRKVNKPFNINKGDWSNLRRIDKFTHRWSFVYEINKLKETDISGIPMLISHKPEEELFISYKNWRVSKGLEPHLTKNKFISYKRNLLTEIYLDEKYEK